MSLPGLSDCVLDHIAIAVRDISHSKKIYEKLGLIFSDHIEEVVEQKVLTAFAEIDLNAHIELVQPTGEDSSIHKFISSKGEGIHHLCFKVANIQLKTEQLRSEGVQFIYPDAKLGAGGCLINFIHPKSTGGVLIEISQRPTL